jgi:site-specific DNA recombinase
MMKTAVYTRYSSDTQREASIEDQVRLCRELVERQGWQVVEIFADHALSGASALRPGYQQLLEDVRAGRYAAVVAESLDRLSRDQEHTAGLFKQLSFAGVRLVTVAEGEIGELHVGLKGTMNALFLRDRALKTHCGLRGRVEQGRSGGGRCYGYAVVPGAPDRDGIPERGLRRIEPTEAAVVRRIFQDYAAGRSAKAIAQTLNRKEIAGPHGGAWGSSTIAGNVARGTGILNNELYVGRLIWNRLRYVKDPATGKRISWPNDREQRVVVEVPELRIVEDELWQAVKARQAATTTKIGEGSTKAEFWDRRRPRYLFSGLMRCGLCGGGFAKISLHHFGCSTARNKGTCANLLTIRRDMLEATVLDALRHRLMDPELYAIFVTEFTAEWNRLQASTGAGLAAKRSELAEVKRRIDGMIRAIEEGLYEPSMKARMQGLERRREALEAELATASEPKPRLHHGLAEIYRQKVATLQEALAAEDGHEAREAIPALIEAIVLVPDEGKLAIEVRGDLAAILALGQTQGTRREGRVHSDLLVQVKLVAGARNHRELPSLRAAV